MIYHHISITINQSDTHLFNLIFLGCVEDITGKLIFACQSLIDQALTFDVYQMHVDATFKVVPSKPKSHQLLIIHIMIDNNVSNLIFNLS